MLILIAGRGAAAQEHLFVARGIKEPRSVMGTHHRPLPEKLCPVCQRSFSWRKKWSRCWDEVKYCSERCRRNRNTTASPAHGGA